MDTALEAHGQTGTASACVFLPTGAVSWWNGEGNTRDLVTGVSATIVPTVSFTNCPTAWASGCRIGRGLSFQGGQYDATGRVGGYLNAGSPATLDDLQQMTAEAWVHALPKNVSKTQYAIFSKQLGDGLFGFNFYIEYESPGLNQINGKLVFTQSFSGSLGGYAMWTTPYPVAYYSGGEGYRYWHHVAVVYDKSSATNAPVFYIDAAPVPSFNVTEVVAPFGTATSDAESIAIIGGRRFSSTIIDRRFNGWIDELTIYNRVLAHAEISDIYNVGNTDPLMNVKRSNNGKCYTGVCGNAIKEIGEQCDDGNVLNGDGCTNICQSSQCITPPADLVSWWPGESNGLDIQSVNNGVMTGGVGFGTGYVGKAFNFSGRNGFINAASPITLDDLPVMTVNGWVNANSYSTSTRIISKQSGPGLSGWNFFVEQLDQASTTRNRLVFTRSFPSSPNGFAAWATPDNSFSSTTWHHVALVHDDYSEACRVTPNDDPKIYIDGVLQPLTELVSPAGLPTSDAASLVTIGARRITATKVQDFFYGLIDELQVHRRALSAGEIGQIIGAGASGQCKSEADSDRDGLSDAVEQTLASTPTGLKIYLTGLTNIKATLFGNGSVKIEGKEAMGPVSVTFPPGTRVPLEFYLTAGSDYGQFLTMSEVRLLPDTTKTVELSEKSPEVCVFDYGASATVPQFSSCVGGDQVKLACDGIARNFEFIDGPRTFKCTQTETGTKIEGLEHTSVFTAPAAKAGESPAGNTGEPSASLFDKLLADLKSLFFK